MKLTEMDPKWVHENGRVVGIRFNCPAAGHGYKIRVLFANPPDGGPPAAAERHWTREGADFEDISLTPSIHAMDRDEQGQQVTHWHGFITRGEVVSC